MQSTQLERRVRRHLDVLAREIGPRPPGSEANRAATTYVQHVADGTGIEVESLPFTARWWEPGAVVVQPATGRPIEVDPSPFSRPCDVVGPVVRVGTLTELEEVGELGGKALVMNDALTAGPLFPRNYPYVSIPDQHRIIDLLEAASPLVVLAVTPSEDATEPILEDGDLSFPYATLTPSVGALLKAGDQVQVIIRGRIGEGRGVNQTLRRGARPRALLSAHIDCKATTVGALDNGASVAGLLALVESGRTALDDVDVVLFNGEDHYAAPGEQAWLAAHDPAAYELVINLDGIGLAPHRTSVCTLACPPQLEAFVLDHARRCDAIVVGPPWIESDHGVFAMRGIPSLALTTDAPIELLKTRSHSPDDSADDIDVTQVATTVEWVAQLVENLARARPRASAVATG